MINEALFLKLISYFGKSCFISFILTFLFRKIAVLIGIVDSPDNILKKQKESVPYLGGVAIYLSFWLIAWGSPGMAGFTLLNPFFVFTTLIIILGVVDDIYRITPFQKFVGQIIITVLMVNSGFYLDIGLNSFFEKTISVFWIIGAMNAFNLVDVMDGLAATISIACSASLLCYAIYFCQPEIALILSILIGSLVAFFYYNAPPATIYLGDAGSMLLGGLISAIALLQNWGSLGLAGYAIPVFILSIPIIETTSLIVIRKVKGIPFYNGSRDHFSHYLLDKNWSKKQILLYVMAFMAALLLLSAFVAIFSHKILLVAVGAIALIMSWIHVVYSFSENR